MFDRYGPNSLKVGAFIKALGELSAERFAAVDRVSLDVERLNSLVEKVQMLDGAREDERFNAYTDALEAVDGKGTQSQRRFVGALATLLVIEDRLTPEERTFVHLFIINPTIPLRLLYADHEKEDRAVEEFCERLSLIDNQNAFVHSRPDELGRAGQGMPDFIINRAGRNFTVEHTSLNTYPKQVFYEKMWAKYFKPLNLEERIKAAYPESFIHVSIPINAFEKESDAQKFDFERFVQNLIEEVGRTPRGRNGGKRRRCQLPATPFAVELSNDDGNGFVGCFIVQIVPTHRERMDEDLTEEVTKAINKKRKKLKVAKGNGENTVLLLDSDDYALVNEEILADAFARAVSLDAAILEGIDDVYIQHRRGTCWVVPVKLGDRVYPDLLEFDDYRHKQWKKL